MMFHVAKCFLNDLFGWYHMKSPKGPVGLGRVRRVPQLQVDDGFVAPISMARPQLLDHEIFMDERAFLAAALDASGLSSGNYLNGFCMILRIGKGREAYPLRQNVSSRTWCLQRAKVGSGKITPRRWQFPTGVLYHINSYNQRILDQIISHIIYHISYIQ